MMNGAPTRRLAALVLLCGLAFALRVVDLGAQPLRGDEAFAVRYWAADPFGAARLGGTKDLNHREPHPFGTFFAFWAWKGLAGEGEFAMRFLPAVGNVLGVAATWALARRLFRSGAAALVAGALWALNPFLIWHAQDARNYALWAALSPLAMITFLRASASSRPRDWALYVAAEAAALYIFFLEAFLLPVQLIYLLAFRRSRDVLRRAGAAWLVLALLLIPWFVQLLWLSRSGYSGTLTGADPAALLTDFLPTLLIGEGPPAPWDVMLPLAWIALLALILLRSPARRGVLGWLLVWIALPATVLLIVATRMSVFHPRYLIAVTPALLLLAAAALTPPQMMPRRAPVLTLARVLLAASLLPGLVTLADYYRGASPKGPDWPTLASFFEERTGPTDLIVFPAPDPTFNYYYAGGPAAEISLVPGEDPADHLDTHLWHDAVWLVGAPPDATRYLDTHYQRLAELTVAGFPVTHYAAREVTTDEIAQPVGATFGRFAHLLGYTLYGPTPSSPAITLVLYWVPLAQTEQDYTVFVHLTARRLSPDGTPLWAQDDHPPTPGTSTWEVGSIIRDAYTLLDGPSPALPPVEATLEVGFYDPATGERAPAFAVHGEPAGDSLPLARVRFPAAAQ